MIACWATYYNEKSSPNKTVSMLGAVVCDECHGKRWVSKDHIRCEECSGDGTLTYQIPFCSELLECAMPASVREAKGWKRGDVLKVSLVQDSLWFEELRRNINGLNSIKVRLNDDQKENDDTRWIDLTEFAFLLLVGDLKYGKVKVTVEKVL